MSKLIGGLQTKKTTAIQQSPLQNFCGGETGIKSYILHIFVVICKLLTFNQFFVLYFALFWCVLQIFGLFFGLFSICFYLYI